MTRAFEVGQYGTARTVTVMESHMRIDAADNVGVI